jgi:hypothetical protein
MNEMELLRELAQETPLPAPAELDGARARLAAAIAAVAEVAMDQPCPPADQPLLPLAPAPVLTAGKFMRGGAITSVAYLIAALPFMNDIKGSVLGHRLTATPLTITLVVLAGLAVVALWLWMARATAQGKGWARTLSTVLFGLATLELDGAHGLALAAAALTWLSGLAAVWLLWRPASSAFFRSAKAARSIAARPDVPRSAELRQHDQLDRCSEAISWRMSCGMVRQSSGPFG